MGKKITSIILLTVVVLLFAGCMRTVDEMYYPPKRSEDYNDLQSAIDGAMSGLDYCAPLTGENQQAVQNADLNGDGVQEYLLFAKGSSEHPLRILVFQQISETYVHVQTMESNGTAFEQVEYAKMDDTGGVEIVVSSQVADQVVRSVSVYTFDLDMHVSLLVTTNCSKFVTVDLDNDGRTELFVLRPGQTDADNGIAELYGMENGILERSNEMSMSESADRLKRVLTGKLHGGEPAVYVASAVEDTMLITDVYAYIDGMLANVSFSNESGTSVKTLRNYYVYADDIDNDGVVELPSLITMKPMGSSSGTDRHDLIRWYAMKADGSEVDKKYTYHNFVGGWFMELDSQWASRLTVLQTGNAYEFYLWDTSFLDTKKILTISAEHGQGRSDQQEAGSSFILYTTESMTLWATLAEEAYEYGVTHDMVISKFHLIQRDWKTGET